MAVISLKVPVATLIEKAEARRAEIVAEYERVQAEERTKRPDFQKAVARLLREAAKNPEQVVYERNYDYRGKGGGYRSTTIKDLTVKVPRSENLWPAQPDEHEEDGPKTARVDRDLGMLRATSETEIRVKADSDLASYL